MTGTPPEGPGGPSGPGDPYGQGDPYGSGGYGNSGPYGQGGPGGPYGPGAGGYGAGGYGAYGPAPGGYRPLYPPGFGPGGVELAGQGSRLVARIVDGLICAVIGYALGVLLSLALGAPDPFIPDSDMTDTTLMGAVYFFYEWAFLVLKNGATPGKMLLHLRIVRAQDAGDLGAGLFAARTVMYVVMGWCCIGILDVLWCLWDQPLRQCLHDKVVNSIVIRGDRPAGPAGPQPGPYAY